MNWHHKSRFIFAIFLLWATIHSAAAQTPIVVTDDSGHRITLTQPARRIVSMAPHLTEQLFAIGAGQWIVGTTEHADYPPQARQIPRIGRAHHVDLERIAALNPDLILIWGTGFLPSVHQTLKRLNVPVFVSEPKTLDSIAHTMELLGTLTAAPDAAIAAHAFRARLNQLRATYAQRTPLTVFYQIWPQPLMTLSGKHIVSEALHLCGGTNLFEALSTLAPQISEEAVLTADPDVLMSAEPNGIPNGALDRWRRWPQMRAVKHGALITLTAETINRHSPRILDGIEQMCAALEKVRAIVH